MRMTRRSWLKTAAAVPLLAAKPWNPARAADEGAAVGIPARLPAKSDFAPLSMTYLDSGGTHPISLGAKRAVEQWFYSRTLDPGAPPSNYAVNGATRERVRGKFAALINAKSQEICLVQSTTAAEHLVVQALGLPAAGGRIVTDTLHFPDSFYLYEGMQKAGMDVVWLKPKDGRSIDLADVERAVTKRTRLVVLALVSNVNGFEHDLKRVCDIAHAKGAYVYADIAQAAGAVPVDVKAANLDFAGCAGYKWLMGDFGLGFLYAREDLLDRVKRTQFGSLQISKTQTHIYPFDPPGRLVADFETRPDATGHFATGTVNASGVALMDYSLDYVRALGVENIQRYRQPLIDHARQELERRGHQCMTPVGSRSPILTFIYQNANTLRDRLDAAKIKVTLADHRIRISPSVFNDLNDIDRLIETVG